MSNIVNTTMKSFMEPHIHEIYDLQTLKKYACPKNQHRSDWYLECVKCVSKDHCKAGQQAVYIVDNLTAPEKKEKTVTDTVPLSGFSVKEQKKREEIEQLFSTENPVRTLLESSPNAKTQSVYSRVYVWRKHYPDLEEKYHMLDQFRFLWSKPYDRMTAGEVLAQLYPEKKEEETKLSEQDKRTVPLSVSGGDDDTISLEDFLGSVEEKKLEPAVKLVGDGDLGEHLLKEKRDREPSPVSSPVSSSISLEPILQKLQKDKADYEERIKDIEKKIDAIRIVQELIQ